MEEAPKVHWWQKFGSAGQIAAAVIAGLGFCAVLLQVNELRRNSRAATARQIYLSFMDLAFNNPQFAEPDYERIKAGDRNERLRYESFVSYLLYACEEALAVFGSEPEWRNACAYDLRPHLPYLCEKASSDSAFMPTFGASTQVLVTTAMTRAGVTRPDCKPRAS